MIVLTVSDVLLLITVMENGNKTAAAVADDDNDGR